MKNKPENAICRFGAGTISRYSAALRLEIPGVRQGKDIEAIHRMRVASRRMRSAFPLFETCYAAKYRTGWRNGIRQITRALGLARDTDVQIERLKNFLSSIQEVRCRPGVRRLILRLQQKRARLQGRVNLALDELEKKRLLDSMDEQNRARIGVQEPGEPYTFGLYALAKGAILDLMKKFLDFEVFIRDPDAVAELHAMRITAKQLRYTLEIFASLYPNELKNHIQAVKAAQEMLGDIHDCDVWAIYLPVFLEKERQRIIKFYGHAGPYKMLLPGITCFQEDRRTTRQKTYEEFLTTWEKWKEKDLWNSLAQTVELPTMINPENTTFPPAAPVVEAPDSSEEAVLGE
jgi:CHAD domain-containing protein